MRWELVAMETEWDRGGSEIIAMNISLVAHGASKHADINFSSLLNSIWSIIIIINIWTIPSYLFQLFII